MKVKKSCLKFLEARGCEITSCEPKLAEDKCKGGGHKRARREG